MRRIVVNLGFFMFSIGALYLIFAPDLLQVKIAGLLAMSGILIFLKGGSMPTPEEKRRKVFVDGLIRRSKRKQRKLKRYPGVRGGIGGEGDDVIYLKSRYPLKEI
jgi:hypothetical protein